MSSPGATWTTTVHKSERHVALEAVIVACSVLGGGYFSLPLACAIATDAWAVRCGCAWFAGVWAVVRQPDIFQLVGTLLLAATI
jgi:hypothetical protein